MNQKLHSSLQMHLATTSKVHLTSSFENGNAVHAWHPPLINHKLEFLQQVHSAEKVKNRTNEKMGLRAQNSTLIKLLQNHDDVPFKTAVKS